MANVEACKERDIATLHEQYRAYTVSRDENGQPTAPHPNGIGAWSMDASKEDRARWQRQLDETGVIPDDAKLTRHKLGIAKWVAHTEHIMQLSQEGKEIPKKDQAAAERVWNADFKEPKVRERQQTIQMFLALPPSEVDNFGGFPQGILWETNAEGKHLTLEQIGAAVVEAFPKSTYKKDPIGRAQVDLGKFNRGQFSCQNGKKPETRYPTLGLPKKEKAEEKEAVTAAE